MREVIDDLVDWWRADAPAGLATVVARTGPTPRGAGAAMAVGPGGLVAGSLAGGCVDGAVYDSALEVARLGRPTLAAYAIGDVFAPAAGCGGALEVYVEPVDQRRFPDLEDVAADLAGGLPLAVATVVEHPDRRRVGRRMVLRPGITPTGGLGSGRADDAVADDGLGLLASGTTATLTYGPDGERLGAGMRVFVASYAAPPRMLVFGALDVAGAVARMGRLLGFRVTVCDPRAVFATPRRFTEADEVTVAQPHRYLAAEVAAGRVDARTVVVVLTHEERIDVPLLEVALRARVAYVGAMGSRGTHQQRLTALRSRGVTEIELARLHGPIGLDLGGRTPEETAVSIVAEIVADRWGGSGRPLSDGRGRIHADHPPA